MLQRRVRHCSSEWAAHGYFKLFIVKDKRLPSHHRWHTEPVHPLLAAFQLPGEKQSPEFPFNSYLKIENRKWIFIAGYLTREKEKKNTTDDCNLDTDVPFVYWDHPFLIPNQINYHSMSPSNTIPLPSPLSFSYPIQLDDDAWLSFLVSIVTVTDSRAVLQNGAVELTWALWVVLHIATVLLQEVLVWGALVIFLALNGVVVGCRGKARVGFILSAGAYGSTKTLAQSNL